jgi:hypothetical protein
MTGAHPGTTTPPVPAQASETQSLSAGCAAAARQAVDAVAQEPVWVVGRVVSDAAVEGGAAAGGATTGVQVSSDGSEWNKLGV